MPLASSTRNTPAVRGTVFMLMPLVACALGAVGCRNNQAQTDLIQRELRQQEDQIYALQDYLAEYQQLLCDARAENESLRQQAVKDQFRDGKPDTDDSLPEPTPPSTPPSPTKAEPEIQIHDNIDMTLPEAPPVETQPTPPAVPPAPPLHDTSRDEYSADDDGVEPASAEVDVTLVDADEAAPEMPTVVAATHIEKPSEEQERPAEEQAYASTESDAVADIVMRAEVALAAEGNGPRVLIELLPVTDAGEPIAYHGDLSLMFMDVEAPKNSPPVARWDFVAAELSEFAHETTHGMAYVFPLQMPTDVPSDRPIELWVRLVPKNGDKVLTHAQLGLDRAGRFVYDKRRRREKPVPSVKVDEAVLTASAELPVEETTDETVSTEATWDSSSEATTTDDGWKTARPGNVATEPVAATGAPDNGTWRTSTQSMPVVESQPARPDPLDSFDVDNRYGPQSSSRVSSREVPEWLPERPRDAAPAEENKNVSPPEWSPTR